MNLIQSQPGVAVIIGCWEEHTQNIHAKAINNIIQFIESSNSIHTILLSDYHTKINSEIQGPNRWYSNAEEIFYSQQGVDWIKRYWKQLDTTQKFVNVSSKILNHSWKKPCISISEQWQLSYLLNHDFSETTNVWYFGIGWNFGIKRDYIGWGQLCDLVRAKHIIKPINILTHRYCVLANLSTSPNFQLTKFDYPNFDKSDWKPLENDVYIKTSLEWS